MCLDKFHIMHFLLFLIYFCCMSYAGADNLIPMELALKIASKIRANERFAVYVVLPMWPEGDPKSEVMQEILYWQVRSLKNNTPLEHHSKELNADMFLARINFFLFQPGNFHSHGCSMQSQTMQMMYDIVARELTKMNRGDSRPKDYLNFYCLGNREENPQANDDLVIVPFKLFYACYKLTWLKILE